MSTSNKPTKPKPLIENRDYYVENGYWVFSALYLKQRGYCCESGCRHCPYKMESRKPKNKA